MAKKKSLMDLDSTEVQEHREFKHNLGGNHQRRILGAGKPFEKKPFEFRAGGNQVLVEEFEASDFLLDRTSDGTPIRAKRSPLLVAMMVLDMVPEDFLLEQVKAMPEEITLGWLTDVLLTHWQPLYLGSLVLGIVLAGTAYLATHYYWRRWVRRNWRKRQERRRQRNPHS